MSKLPLPNGKFNVILADPPWRFEPRSRKTGLSRAADNHYSTDTVEDICAIPVSRIMAKNCVLFLWATVPMMPQALVVMSAWEFRYKSGFVWAKDKIGTGCWNRNQHELLLVGMHRRVPAPKPRGLLRSSLIQPPRRQRRHSQKPAEVYELIESYFPNYPKIELFARAPREGWQGWGLEFGGGPASREPDAPKPDHERTATGALGGAVGEPSNEDVSLA